MDLEKLKNGVMGLSPTICTHFMHACAECLDHHGHADEISFSKTNDPETSYNLMWSKNPEEVKRGLKDMQEVTEWGATAIALLMAEQESECSIAERSAKGTGIDWWLGEDDDDYGIFQKKARLEISGILAENKNNTIEKRVKEKIAQTKVSNNTGLKAHISITDFKSPKTQYHIVS